MADYFLFDLQRGYCDYYATAFIVLARLNGLPARFATGYAIGSWDDTEREWTVTEAQAHSWPEVYFPQAGWVAFEPTAGRPPLVRWAAATAPTLPGPQATPQFDPFQPTGIQWRTLWGIAWNWQMLFWLLPIGLLLAGLASLIWRWRLSREDAWLGLLAWGTRLGRPAEEGETELEYGQELTAHLSARGVRPPPRADPHGQPGDPRPQPRSQPDPLRPGGSASAKPSQRPPPLAHPARLSGAGLAAAVRLDQPAQVE